MKKKNEDDSKQVNAPLLYKDHKLPTSRREFLAAGLMGMSTVALTSGTASLLSSSNAWGALTCPTGNLLCGNVPFLCLDGAGGMNIAGGNVIVGFGSNQEQEEFAQNVSSDFRRLGIPDAYHPSKSGMINSAYGLKFHTTSGILAGMEEVLAPRVGETMDLRDYVDGLLLCAITNDDTNGNPLNTTYMAQKAGASGELVQLIGNQNSVSGGSSVAPSDQVNLTLKPSQLTSFASSSGLLSIGDSIMGPTLLDATGNGGSARLKAFMNTIARGGSSHFNNIKLNSALVADIDKYSGRQGRTLDVFDKFSPAALNPATNAADRVLLEKVYNKTLAMITGGEQTAANIFNLLTNRTAGAATISVGGCDYHTGNAVNGNDKDKEMGRYIGYAIRMASERGKPMFIHLFTDGGVTGDAAGQVDANLPTRVVWRSDDGVRSAAMMIVFNPNKKRAVVGDNEHSNFLLAGKTRQIGYYTVGGGSKVDAHSLSNNVNKLWMAVILNYMATLINSTDDEKIISEVKLGFEAKFGSGSLPPDWKDLIRLKSLVA